MKLPLPAPIGAHHAAAAATAMAYRRKLQPQAGPPSFEHHPPSMDPASPPQDSLAAQAMRASAAHRDASSVSSAYSSSAAARRSHEPSVSTPSPDSSGYVYTSTKSLNEAKYGFCGTLARKAESFLDEDTLTLLLMLQYPRSQQPPAETWKSETPPSQKRSEAIASSLNYIGGTIKRRSDHCIE